MRFLTFDIRNNFLDGMLARNDDDDQSPLPVKVWLRDVDTDGEESSDDEVESHSRLADGRGPMAPDAPGPTGAPSPSGHAPSMAASGSSAGPSFGAEAAPSGAALPPWATGPRPRAASETTAPDGAQAHSPGPAAQSQKPAVGPAAPVAAATHGSLSPRRPSPAQSASTSAPGPDYHGHASSPQALPGAPSAVGAFSEPSIPAPRGSTLASNAPPPPHRRDRSRSRDRAPPAAHRAQGGGGRSGWAGSGPTAAGSAHAPRSPRGGASVSASPAVARPPSFGRTTPGARSAESLLRPDVEDAQRQANLLTASLHSERRAADGAAASLADIKRDLSDLQAPSSARRSLARM